jgi:hypothetical protein
VIATSLGAAVRARSIAAVAQLPFSLQLAMPTIIGMIEGSAGHRRE